MKQELIVSDYDWKVTIYYTVSSNDVKEITSAIEMYKCNSDILESIKTNLQKASQDTGFTYSSYLDNHTIMVIHKASSIGEFVNTFEHEKMHLAMHICEALDINPYSEEAAHLIGNLSQQILEEALCFIIEI